MATNFELYDICVKTLAAYNPLNSSVSDLGIMSTHDACISIIHNHFAALDSERRNKLKNVLFQFAVSDGLINDWWHCYKHDNECDDLTITDYVKKIFIHDDSVSVLEAYTSNGGYEIDTATMALLREILKDLLPKKMSKSQKKHFNNCLKRLQTNGKFDTKPSKSGFITNNEAYISIIYNYFNTYEFSECRRENLKRALFNYAVSDSTIKSLWHDYKDDNRCHGFTIEDYVNNVFLDEKRFTVDNAYTNNGGYDINKGTLALVREMMLAL